MFIAINKVLMIVLLSWIATFSNSVLQAQEVIMDDGNVGDFADGHRYLNLAKESTEFQSIVIEGATLIDGTGGAVLEDARIVIVGERIKAIGQNEVQIPEDARIIDAKGKIVMPGLIDAHGHYREFEPELMINYGITSQIDTGNYMDYALTIRDLIAEGKLWGNRVFTTGSGITGENGKIPSRDRYRVSTPEEARIAAEIHVQRGVDFIKVYDELTVDQLRAVTEVAHKAGLKVVGHLGPIDAREAVAAGIDGLVHGRGISMALVSESESKEMKERFSTPLPKGVHRNPWGQPGATAMHWNMDESKFDDLIKLLVDNNVMIEPDLVHSTRWVIPQWDRFELESRRLLDNPGLHYIPDHVKERWFNMGYIKDETPEGMERRRLGVKKYMDFLVRFVKAGGVMLAGSDTAGDAVIATTLHQEIELFVDMGLTPMEALLTATKNVAEFYLPGKGLGTLVAGNLADLIILGANPLEDIRNTRKVEMVMIGGKVMEMGYHVPYAAPFRELFIKTAPSPYRHLFEKVSP